MTTGDASTTKKLFERLLDELYVEKNDGLLSRLEEICENSRKTSSGSGAAKRARTNTPRQDIQNNTIIQQILEKKKLYGKTKYVSVEALKDDFIVHDNKGKGNCFFLAMQEGLEFIKYNDGLSTRHQDMRQWVVIKAPDFIRRDFFVTDDETVNVEDAVSKWLAEMEENGCWADELVIATVSLLYGVCIYVYKETYDESGKETNVSLIKYEVGKCDEKNIVRILNTGPGAGTHFEFISPK
jgi:hypothetical protein